MVPTCHPPAESTDGLCGCVRQWQARTGRAGLAPVEPARRGARLAARPLDRCRCKRQGGHWRRNGQPRRPGDGRNLDRRGRSSGPGIRFVDPESVPSKRELLERCAGKFYLAGTLSLQGGTSRKKCVFLPFSEASGYIDSSLVESTTGRAVLQGASRMNPGLHDFSPAVLRGVGARRMRRCYRRST